MGSNNNLACVFPGQGSQSVGMGLDLYEQSPAARRVFEAAEDALGWAVSRFCFQGSEDDLRDTARQQPALLTVSIATLAALEELLGKPVPLAMVAGHSVGQFAALVAGGVLDFKEAIILVAARGQLMKEAGQRNPGGMAAVLGLDEAAVEEICREASQAGVVCPANYNMPGQIVISGDHNGLAKAAELAVAKGARKVIPLAVSVANHSPLMSNAADEFAKLVRHLHLTDAKVPVVANRSARAVVAAEEVRAEVIDHMTSPVRWSDSVARMQAGGVTTFVELGPGQVLTGMIKRSGKDVKATSAGGLEAIRKMANVLAGAEVDVV